jgi:hypothetical protein
MRPLPREQTPYGHSVPGQTVEIAMLTAREPNPVSYNDVRGVAIVCRILLPFGAGLYLSFLFRVINALIAPRLALELGIGAAGRGTITPIYFLAFTVSQLGVERLLDPWGVCGAVRDRLNWRVLPQVEAGGDFAPGHFDEPRVTAASINCPLRQVVRFTVVPGANFEIFVAKSLELLSGNPLIEVTTSPVWIPARAAGLSGSGRSKIAPYGSAIPRLAAKAAVIGRTWTPKNEHS